MSRLKKFILTWKFMAGFLIGGLLGSTVGLLFLEKNFDFTGVRKQQADMRIEFNQLKQKQKELEAIFWLIKKIEDEREAILKHNREMMEDGK